MPRESHVEARSADRRGCHGRTEYCSSYRTLLLLALQGALAMVTGKCLLELVALLAEIGAKVLELRVQVLACGGIHGEAVCAWL